MTKKQTTIITALTIVIFLLAFLITQRHWFRFDLTKNKAYTISKVSRNLHADIPDFVNITYYLSSKLNTVMPSPGEIEDTLREYAAYSRGKIRVQVRDPLSVAVTVQVEELGLQPMQIQTVERDQASLATVYSGIVIEYLDKMEVLPWIISTETLEYDLTSRIRSMVTGSERRIGIIIGDSFRQWWDNFTFLNQTFTGAGYRVRLIYPGDEIPDNLPVLFVLGGVEEMGEWALYRIDRYIQLGGKVLFAVEGVYVDTIAGSIEARHQQDQGLLAMLASYGVVVLPELALDRNALTIQYQTRTPAGAFQMRVVRYPLWIGVLADNGNPDHPASAALSGLDLYWPSPIELHPSGQIEAVPLFTTTDQGWSMRDPFYTSPDVTYLLEKDASETRGTKILGASLTGQFPSFFADYPKPIREGSEEELPDMPTAANTSRIIVIGDTDFTTDTVELSGASYNLDFLLRAADWLSSEDDIVGIRNRQPHVGRLDRIVDEEDRISAIRFSQIVNVGLIPLFVIVMGFVLAWRRRLRAGLEYGAAARSGKAPLSFLTAVLRNAKNKFSKEKSNGV
jgi:gliding-associated putative ABC transporter substrate-binding component GldG